MKKLLLIAVCALAAMLSFTGCQKDGSSKKLIGTWEWVSSTDYYSNGETETYSATADNWHTYTFTDTIIRYADEDDPNGTQTLSSLEYTFDGEYIRLIGGLFTLKVEKLTSSELILREESLLDFGSDDEALKYTLSTYKKK